jgi:hypothetical protein
MSGLARDELQVKVSTTTDNKQAAQKYRARRREGVLALWARMVGCRVQIECMDATAVTGVLAAVDAKQQHFLVKDLRTPIGVYEHGVVRAADVAAIHLYAEDEHMDGGQPPMNG